MSDEDQIEQPDTQAIEGDSEETKESPQSPGETLPGAGVGEFPGVEVDFDAHVNYAMQQNDVPVVKKVGLTNQSDSPIRDLTVRVWIDSQISQTWERRIEAIGSGETFNLSPVDLVLDPQVLVRQVERERTQLHVAVHQGEREVASTSYPIEVLAYNEWAGIASLPEIMGAFVLPNHPIVNELLSEAAKQLQQATGSSALSGYQHRSIERVRAVVRAIYAAISQRQLGYITAPASFEHTGQKVRLPDQIMAGRMGNCLDLTLLLAACLEQAGLHPLVILVKDHAFVGVWTGNEWFPEPAVEEPLRLRKRVQLAEIMVVEATMLTSQRPDDFDEACRSAGRHLDDTDAFISAIDIRCARTLSIRPLPMRVAEGEYEVVVPQEQSSPASPPAPGGGTTAGAVSAASGPNEMAQSADGEPGPERLERWKRKLLDLSLRNRILNFKETKKSIPLLSHDVSAVEDRLAEGVNLSIHPKPNLMDEDQPRDATIHEQRTGEDAVKKYLEEELDGKRLHASLTEKELERRLVEIYRAARSTFEESGANTLYLAVGFLQWYETDTSETQRLAPILLLPVELIRPRGRGDYRLKLSDDEPRINVTLLEKLKVEFGLVADGLDELTAGESGLDVKQILDRFRVLIKDMNRWDVLDQVQLGLFSFTKFLMWLDLQERSGALLKNRLVRHLVDRSTNEYASIEALPNADTLDQDRKSADIYCPRDADSSQLAAVFAAHEGRTFVLEGPPGTGKSQTITNLVAHCLGHGKRVLFVSEKMAALKVVHKRLSDNGLGPFCLELHSHQANKLRVLRQIQEALDFNTARTPPEWKRLATSLDAARLGLNNLVEALHETRPIGESVFQVTSRLIGLKDQPRLEWTVDDVHEVTADQLAAHREMTSRLTTAAETIGAISTHPLRAIQRHEWQASLPDQLEQSIGKLKLAASELHQAADALCNALKFGLSVETLSRSELRFLQAFGELLTDTPRPTQTLLEESDWATLQSSLEQLIERGRVRNRTRTQLFEWYQPDVLREDLVLLRGRLVQNMNKWVLLAWWGCRPVRKRLRLLRKDSLLPDNKQLLADLDAMLQVRQETEELGAASCRGAMCFGLQWQGGEGDWDQLSAVIEWTDQYRKLVSQSVLPTLGQINGFRTNCARLATELRDQCAAGAMIGRPIETYQQAYKQYADALQQVIELTQMELDETIEPTSGAALQQIEQMLRDWQSNLQQLNDWCYWRRTREEARQTGLGALVSAYESGTVQPAQFRAAVDHTIYRQWFNAVTDRVDILRQFNSSEHQYRIEAFRELDKDHIRLSQDSLLAILATKVPTVYTEPSDASEMGILQNQLKLKRRHMPVRKLIHKLPHLLPRLKPCVLMSPMSVAQYLDPSHPPFDLVVFDEASQIPVWDAIGAIARGDRAIIVGDSKQLPPTNFFMKLSGEDEYQDENDFEELESILDECSASGVPSMRLRWHYRSRHESLIAFSNYHYYDNRLHTFPSPVAETKRMGVSMRFMDDGIYDRGKSRTNRAEAEALVAELVQRLRAVGDDESKSIGVVTFSMQQQRLIEDQLDEARLAHPEIERYFTNEVIEPVFVKNLENVQGDERASILFSICYGPDVNGRVAMNFGPLNRDGGERRLNVAITRAREQVIVFSSLRPEKIDLSRTSRVGVRHLKTFLEYAERGPAAIAEAITLDHSADFESPFEKSVCEALEQRGWQVDLQVGCSGYRIDLAIRDPQAPGEYLLGIECDGATYHSAKTARDRDRIRQGVLEHLGWSLHRIWSRDWWANPDGVIQRIDTAIEDARRRKAERRRAAAAAQLMAAAPPEPEPENADDEPEEVEEEEPAHDRPAPMIPGMFFYETISTKKVRGTADDFYESRHHKRVKKSLLDIVNKEAPIAFDLVAQRLMDFWQISRQTSRVTRRVDQLLNELQYEKELAMAGDFIWKPDQNQATYPGFRVPASDDEQPREPEELPSEEIANACEAVLKQQISMPEADLYREVGRLFGFTRLTDRLERALRDGITLAEQRGQMRRVDGRIVLPSA